MAGLIDYFKLAAGSIVAFRTLFELNISNTVKDMLSTYDLSHGTLYVSMVDGHNSQIHEVLKLLNELLPAITEEQDGEQKSDKEVFLLSHPDILQKFGVDLLPILIQLFGWSVYKEGYHVIILALRIVDTIMLKLPHVYLNSFVKEGVLFAIYALLSPDKDMKHSPVFDGIKMENDATLRSATRDVHRCPCFTFDTGQSARSPENGTCKLRKDTVQNLANHIWNTYFETESVNPEKGVTDILQKLRTLSSALTELLNKSMDEATSSQQEKEIYDLLHQIMSELNDKDSISTFEFVESGIMKALVYYLSNASRIIGREDNSAVNNLCIMEKRFEVFGRLLLSCANTAREEFPLLILVRRLQSALSSVENFPVISSHSSRRRNSYATVPYGRCTSYPCLKVHFVREKGEVSLRDYADDIVNVDPFVSLEEIEGYLRPRVTTGKTKILRSESKDSKEKDSSSSHSPSDSSICQAKSIDVIQSTEMLVDFHKLQDKESNLLLSSPADTSSSSQRIMDSADVADVHTDPLGQKEHDPLQEDGGTNLDHPGCSHCEDTSPKLLFYLDGQQLNCKLTLYQSILNLQTETDHDSISSASLWNRIYKLTYRRRVTTRVRHPKHSHDEAQCSLSKRASFFQYTPYFSPMFASEVDFEKLGPTYDILSLLKSLEGINRLRFHLMSRDRTCAFAEGRTDDLDNLNLAVSEVPQNEFVNKKLTEKLEQQMRDPMAVSVGAMPAWCTQLMAWCPFLFGFEARCKYFHLAALGRSPVQTHSMSHGNVGVSGGRQQSRRKILVHRNKVLESAAQMMELHAHQKVPFEVEYDEEVGTGLGPTLEFYTLVCHEFQRSGLGMWRDDTGPLQCTTVLETANSGFLVSPFGLFPRPWSPSLSASSSAVYSEVITKFSLLGYIVAKAIQDGRVLDLPLSKALYKLILGKELSLYDIQSFDPASGRALLEFQAVVERKEYLRSLCNEESPDLDVCLRNTKIEDLCLDFTLPGYPDYVLVPETDSRMVSFCSHPHSTV
ncbi:UNVERIFIED_CONTAM: E3 ubiquitin-protein ligase UPL4 [Sesamum radiatum]|uniref:E3 ubiquitin-protein ligase UPL4 n=1 Tax=Sesamum radiatum TaxID=300843 RepID=A0AAW2R586_SESRA